LRGDRENVKLAKGTEPSATLGEFAKVSSQAVPVVLYRPGCIIDEFDIELSQRNFHAVAEIVAYQARVPELVEALQPTMTKAPDQS